MSQIIIKPWKWKLEPIPSRPKDDKTSTKMSYLGESHGHPLMFLRCDVDVLISFPIISPDCNVFHFIPALYRFPGHSSHLSVNYQSIKLTYLRRRSGGCWRKNSAKSNLPKVSEILQVLQFKHEVYLIYRRHLLKHNFSRQLLGFV